MKSQQKGSIDLPKLAAPAQRALAGAGIHNLKDLTKFSEAELEALHGIGPNALKELRRAMKVNGYSFRGTYQTFVDQSPDKASRE